MCEGMEEVCGEGEGVETGRKGVGGREEGWQRQGGRLEAIKRWKDVLKNMTKKIIKH